MAATLQTIEMAQERRSRLGRLVLELTNKRGPLTSEERLRLRALNAEMDALEDDIAIESERKYDAALSKFLHHRYVSGEELESFDAREKRDMATGTGAGIGGNGPLAPISFTEPVFVMLRGVDRLFDPEVVTIITTDTGGAGAVPNMDDTASSASLVPESGQGSMLEPTLGALLFPICPTWRSGVVKFSLEPRPCWAFRRKS